MENEQQKDKGHGGARPGAGRKAKVDENKTRDLAIEAIKGKYGEEMAGFQALLNSQEPSLIKWVFEHAYGKPKERIELDATLTGDLYIGYGKPSDDEEDQ